MLNFQTLVKSLTAYYCFCPVLGWCPVFSVKIKVQAQVFELELTPFCWNRHKNQIVELVFYYFFYFFG